MEYEEDDMLMLSGIQHFAFCPRQWALIHIDQQWEENRLTIEGQIIHNKVNDPFYRQKMGNVICLRSVHIASKELGLYGISDIVELHKSEEKANSITHPKYEGFWKPYPIEYKHGKPKGNNIDAVQLAAQAMCLEEQYNLSIPEGAIYYAQNRHRETITIDDNLRNEAKMLAASMHEVYLMQKIPSAEFRACCRSCSLNEKCMPKTANKQNAINYLKANLYEETT
jgi:CRISPR-associated exonuclease Cas4